MSVPPRRALNPDEIISQNDIAGYYVNGQFLPEDSAEAARDSTTWLFSPRGRLSSLRAGNGWQAR